MDSKNFGQKLKHLRKSKGLTQQVLAEKAEIDEKHLSRIENGKFFPTYSTLSRLLSALSVTVDDVGLDLNNIDINTNPTYNKIMQIINAATELELPYYLECLKTTQKIIKAKNF